MKARPRAAVVLKIMIPALAVMLPLAAFGVALDYNISGTCGSMFGCWYAPPSGYSACGNPTSDMGASTWVRDMSREFVAQVNKISGYGSGIEKINTADALMYEVCNTSYSRKCQDQVANGINYQYAGLLAIHGASKPVSEPGSPTFYAGFSSYSTSGSIAGSADCTPQLFGKMYLGLPRLKFLMILSCDSMNVASDLPKGADQVQGWFANTWGVHVITGFSGEDHLNANTTTMDSFIADQKSQGIGPAWMNHFNYFSPTGNNTQNGASDCATATVFGNSAYVISWFCNCCADYGGNEGVHCTPKC